MDEKEEIRKWLIKNNLKPYHLAKMAGVSFPTVYRFLQGKRGITLVTLKKLQAVMK